VSGSEHWSLDEYHQHMKTGKRTKYGNRQVRHEDGTVFDSVKEMARYNQLLIMQTAGEIKDLKCQPRFVLQESFKYQGKTVRAITFKADFVYRDMARRCLVVEDVKGGKATQTQAFNLRWKMAKYKFPTIDWVIV
jgi:hypothetical protein